MVKLVVCELDVVRKAHELAYGGHPKASYDAMMAYQTEHPETPLAQGSGPGVWFAQDGNDWLPFGERHEYKPSRRILEDGEQPVDCRDCRHVVRSFFQEDLCGHPQHVPQATKVATWPAKDCRSERFQDFGCGPTGAYFEERG